MNKLLQHMMNGGMIDHKILPKFQFAGPFGVPKRVQTQRYDSFTSPKTQVTNVSNQIKGREQIARKKATEAFLANQATIRPAEERSGVSKAIAIAANPMTAASYLVKGQRIPDYFDRGATNNYDVATSILNPISAVYSGSQISGNLRDGDYLQAGLNTIDFIPGIKTIPKATRSVINVADRNLSRVGRDLSRIEREGFASGLSDFDIARRQLDQVGITSNQRKAYVPGVSEFLEKYVVPYNYSGFGNDSKLIQTLKNIFGKDKSLSKYSSEGVLSETRNPAREDAWSLYLGKPQRYNTFRMAETAPVNHSSYSGNRLNNMDLYSVNYEEDLIPNIDASTNSHSINKNIEPLLKEITLDREGNVMGGYNRRLSSSGLQYNDIWDLEPSVTVPFTHGTREIKIPIHRFIGKPFMSHGNIPYTWTEHQTKLAEYLDSKIANRLAAQMETGVDFTPQISRFLEQLEKVKSAVPIKKQGGPIVSPRGQWDYPGQRTIVPTPNGRITMKGVPYPVYGQDETGYGQMMMPGGEYTFPGQMVDEIPMMQGGGTRYVDSVLNANRNLNWVNRLYEKNPQSIQIPGQRRRSTHFMESGDGRVYPSVVQMPDGSLKYLGDKAYNYADSTKTFIQFPSDKEAQWFGKNYKKGTSVLNGFAKGGQNDSDYKGGSIVDYLATKGYSGSKAFRKDLAKQYGVENYDFSAKKNTELLSKLRENDEMLESFEQTMSPVSVEKINEIISRKNQNVSGNDNQTPTVEDENEKFNAFRRKMIIEMGFDPFLEGRQIGSIQSPNLSLSSSSPYYKENLLHGLQGEGSTTYTRPQAKPQSKSKPLPPSDFRYVKPLSSEPINPYFKQPYKTLMGRAEEAPIVNQPIVSERNSPEGIQYKQDVRPIRQMSELPKKITAKTAANKLNKEENDRAWYEQVWDAYANTIGNNQFKWGTINIGGGLDPQKIQTITRDLTKGVLSVISDDLAEKYQNKLERQDAKLNSKERKSVLDPSKVMFDPVYVTGDTIPDSKRRYHIPEIIDLDYMRFGVRNRGDLKEIQTEGAPITTFEPFQNSKQYFAKTKDPANATYVGVAPDGRIKVGGRNMFQDQDYQVTRTFSNKVVDFNRDKTGSILKVPSNPKASKETLSPSVKVLNDEGKLVDGKLSLLLPPKGNQEESFDLVTGGRYIFQTPDGKTKLVSGSLKNIESEFYKMKKNHPWVNVVTLDNGSYARGIRTFDQKLTKQDLRKYDNQNTGGGNFAYILPGERKTRYDSKFTDFEAEAKRRLQAMYPGKNVSIGFQNSGLYDQTGGRDIESQIAIQRKGNSQTPVSLHNFGAAKDYILYVDGKPVDPEKNKKLYKDVLWNAADKTGLYHLEDWDPTHISLAKEGQKTAFDELYTKYPDIFSNPNFVKSLNFINKNRDNPLYEEYYELLSKIQPFTGKPRTTELMKRTVAKKQNGGQLPFYQMKGEVTDKQLYDPRRVIYDNFENPRARENKVLQKILMDEEKSKNFLTPVITNAANFMQGWQDSPMYSKMLENKKGADGIKAIRQSMLNKAKSKNAWSYEDLDDEGSLGSFTPGSGRIAINKNLSDKNQRILTGIHEMSHASDVVPRGYYIPKEDIDKMLKYQNEYNKNRSFWNKQFMNPEYNSYVADPTETRARLNTIRYIGKTKNVYDPYTQSINNKQLNNIDANSLEQLRLIYSDDQIVDMLNSISMKNNQGLPFAKSGGQHGGLDRWFAEKWVDIKTGKPCGRQQGENRSYPACRPSKRVSSQTPKTASELSSSEREKFKRSKTSSERINYQHRRN